LALANAINFELDTAPAICNSITQAMNGDVIEKNLCHVKQELTAYEARKLCENNGMRLFQPKSSASARKALVLFGSTYLGASPKAQFYVHGRRGNRCQTAKGNGALTKTYCHFELNAMCEYFEVRHLLCDTTTLNRCKYKTPIVKDNMVMYLEGAATYAGITAFDVEFVPGTTFFPVDLGTTFPNLEYLYAWSCSVAKLNRQTFAGMTKLKYLDLDSNKLTEVRSSTFDVMPSLQTLYLSEPDVLIYETSIHFLIFTDRNPLTTISADLFTVTFPNLSFLNLIDSNCISESFSENPEIRTILETTPNTCALV
jgi:hypothetical protein